MIKIDEKHLDTIIKKYQSINPDKLKKWAEDKRQYFDKMNATTKSMRGFEEGRKGEFYEEIKDFIYFVDDSWKPSPKIEIKIEEPQEETFEQLRKVVNNFSNKTTMAYQFLKHQPIYYDKFRNWWKWNDTELKWEICDETDILNLVDKLCETNTINTKEKNEIIEVLKQKSRRMKPKDIKKTWIQFKDTIVDVLTGEELKASPKYFVTNPIPYELHKERFVETPVMDRIFEEWVGKDYIQTLYEILAYCLIPDYPLHRIFCFIGSGMNGKSCFLNLLRNFIGKDNVCSTELDSLISSRFEVSRLHKKLVCQMGETNFNEMNKTSMLKKLSGGDLIGFEYKRKDPFEEENYAKILIATNNLPTTSDKTIGFYRRWMIIDFPNQFSERKDILKDIPEEEYEILAVKCLGILKDLLEERKFHKEGSIEDRKKRYEDKSDFLQSFLEEFVIEDTNEYITKKDFNMRFEGWCKERGHRFMAENTLGKKMKEKGYEVIRKVLEWSGGSQIRVWDGLKWRE